MEQTFNKEIWRRSWVVNDLGIHEQRQDGTLVTVPWSELVELNHNGAFSESGTRIRPILGKSESREFKRHALQIWKQRYPDRWKTNDEKLQRSAKMSVYVWIPLLILGPCAACYVLYAFLGWPDLLQPEIQKLHRTSIVGVVAVSAITLWFRYRLSKAPRS